MVDAGNGINLVIQRYQKLTLTFSCVCLGTKLIKSDNRVQKLGSVRKNEVRNIPFFSNATQPLFLKRSLNLDSLLKVHWSVVFGTLNLGFRTKPHHNGP